MSCRCDCFGKLPRSDVDTCYTAVWGGHVTQLYGGRRRSAQQTDAWVRPSSKWFASPVETQVINRAVPPGHPCHFPLPFPFFLFFRSFPLFFLSFLSFSVFPFLVFVIVLSFSLVFRLFFVSFFAFLFASLLPLVADSDILLFRLDTTPPPRSLRAWSMRTPLACCLLSSFLRFWCRLTIFFLPFLPFFDFDLDIVCFILSFSYYAVSSVSVSAATRLVYNMYLPAYVRDVTFLFCLRYTICFSYCVYYLLFCICFPPEVIFRSRVIGACPVTTDCIVAMR